MFCGKSQLWQSDSGYTVFLVTFIWELGFVIRIQSGQIKRTWVGHTIRLSSGIFDWKKIGDHCSKVKLKDFTGRFSIYLLNPPWILNSAGNILLIFKTEVKTPATFRSLWPPDPDEGHKTKDLFLFSSWWVGEVQSTRNLPLVFKHTNRTFSLPPQSKLEGNFEQLINGKQHFCSAAKHNIHT